MTLATAGLAVGFVALGAYYYGPPFPESLWLARVAEVGFVAAIAGYAVTITPAIWRALDGVIRLAALTGFRNATSIRHLDA